MEQRKSKILVADDEREIRELLKLLLTGAGYLVVTAENGKEAVEKADETVDLFLLDVNMPVMTGLAAGMELRRRFFAPMIFLTAYSGESDKMMGFSVGADDYIVKPFSNGELLLRVQAQLRRSQQYSREMLREEKPAAQQQDVIVLQDLTIHLDSQTVQRGEEVILLTYTEFNILKLLATHPKRVYSIDNIYESVWEEDAVGDSAVMVHIKNLRKKLGDNSRNPRYIKTAWGKGYYVD